MTHLNAYLQPESRSDPGGGQHADADWGELEAVGAVVEVEFVEAVGIHLLEAVESGAAQFTFQLVGREEEAERLAGSGYALG
jgi:hypothetical protein